MEDKQLLENMKRVFIDEKIAYNDGIFTIKGKTISDDELKILVGNKLDKIDDNYTKKSFNSSFNLMLQMGKESASKPSSKKEQIEQADIDYSIVLKEAEVDFPFKFSTKEGGNWFVHVIKDMDLRIVETKQTSIEGDDLFNTFKNDDILIEWMSKMENNFNNINEFGFSTKSLISKLRDIYITGSMTNAKKVMIKDVKTFSRDLLDWKLSWIDEQKINAADENNIPTWCKFRDSLVNAEYSFKQFAAWIWVMFDEDAVNNNRQCLWLYGDGFDGKSTIINMIKNIINNDITKTDGCGSLNGNIMTQFWATSVVDKVLVCVNEVRDPHFLSSSYIHQWLGGDDVSVEAKGMTPYSKQLRARCVIASNPEPIINKSENNEITRIIPIRIAKSFFNIDKLNETNKNIVKNTFKEDLFRERWNFLKFCKLTFQEMYNRELNLVKFTMDSLDNQISDSITDIAMSDLKSMFEGKNKLFFKTTDLGQFTKWFLARRQVTKGFRGLVPIMNKIGFTHTNNKTDRNDGGRDKGYVVNIDVSVLSEYNNDAKWGLGNNKEDNKMVGYEHSSDPTPKKYVKNEDAKNNMMGIE